MKRVNENDLPWVERTSPGGRFHKFRRDLYAALAAAPDDSALPDRPPFEVELMRLPAGAANFPFHSHSAEWECYLVLAGTGTLRSGEETAPLGAGD